MTANWRTKSIGSVDVEFGFSCMGYEISGGWGASMGQMETAPGKDTIVFTGDGSYMLLNSDIYSSVLSGRKMIVFVCDNGGFAVINKLQNNTGNASYNNLIRDCNLAVDRLQSTSKPMAGRWVRTQKRCTPLPNSRRHSPAPKPRIAPI